MKALIAAIAGSIGLAMAVPILAQDSPSAHSEASWRAVTAQTGQIRDLPGLEELAQDFPDSASVRLRLLQAQLGAGEQEGAIASLEWLKLRGYVFSKAAQQQLPELLGEFPAETIAALLNPEAEVITASTAYVEVPKEAGLIEGLFVRADRGMLVATSITGKSIHIYVDRGVEDAGEGSAWSSIAIPGASDLSGIVGEPDDSMGWAASANLDGSDDPRELFTGLMGLRSDFQNPVLVPVPEGVEAVSDLVVSEEATVYASDPIGGGIYRKPVGAVALEEIIAPGTFRSPQGLALSETGDHLYVSEYRYGLAVVDLASSEVMRVSADGAINLDGIDALSRHGRYLIAVQNGTSPMRILALRLAEDGKRITDHRILEQAHPAWTEPLGASISENTLFYVATGQWDRFEKGEPLEEKPPIPTQIRRIELDELRD